ncbi:hypothetical protein DBR32_10105 [Taibaiella sp. KBW10]|uniref:hypothetical protein n=1 Tax=Taibaiella sp. KBW10 TaxID=2153357 RepID=UPI000F5AABDF|nr:hypothetical protein [Taibaiella sp. KBW10]RQO31050.1 hypothetical protein DBR32_10105 [Taibaiella sp. KBW10]
MKKIFLATLALVGTYGMAEAANVLTVNNLTGCTYTLSISGAGYATIGPGVTIINSFPTANIDFVKIMYTFGGGAVTQVNVGITQPYHNSMGQPTPPCITASGSTLFTGSWAQASPTANAALVIF